MKKEPLIRGSLSFLLFLAHQLFKRRDLYADTEDFHGLLEILEGWIGGRDTDVAVVGVLAVGEGGTSAGHDHASLLGQGDRPLGGAGHGIEADEVTALGPTPGGDLKRRDLPVEGVQDRDELGPQYTGVLFHELQGVRLVLEILHVPQL